MKKPRRSPTPELEALGHQIEALRIRRGYASINALGRAAGVPGPTLSRLIKGERGISVDNLVRIRNELGVSMGLLFGEVQSHEEKAPEYTETRRIRKK